MKSNAIRSLVLVVMVVVPLSLLSGRSSASPCVDQGLTIEQVLERVGRYVVDYGERMSLVIGAEHYVQGDSYRRAPPRTLVSECALVRVGDDWLGFRDVYEADGKPVRDRRDRLERLFFAAGANAVEQGRRIADESARYNVGAVQRNFNVPTMSLFFVHPINQGRFRFSKKGEDRIEGAMIWKIGYRESRTPTIIRTSNGMNMPVSGTFWVDPVDGRVMRTEMEINLEVKMGLEWARDELPAGLTLSPELERERRRQDSRASITVSYKPNPALGILVPAEMLESYEGVAAIGGRESLSHVRCRATYSDFKRFQTGARVVPK